MNIAEVREKFPQYKDLSDEQLAKGLHGKFYADMPYEQFAVKIGLKTEAPKEPESKPLPANAGLASFLAHTLGAPVDAIEGYMNAVEKAMGRPLTSGSFGGAESIKRGMNWLAKNANLPGLSPDNPTPQDPTGTAQYNFVARGGAIPGGAIPAAASMAAEAALGPEWAGVGAMTPQALAQAGGAAKRAVVNPETVQRNVETFKQAGTRPDVAQATESNFLRGLTNVIGRFPGGQGIITKFREREQEALANSAKTGVSAEKAGRAIKEGITGEGGFLERTKATWIKLDDELAQKVGPANTFVPTNTVAALDDLTRIAPGAEKTSAGLVNSRIAEIKANLQADLQNNAGVIPFDTLRSLRAKVGSMLDDSLVSGIPNGELKKLYGSLTRDLEAAATKAGAGDAFARQNTYYKARMDRIENTLDSVLGDKKTFEQIFKGVAPTDVESVNTVRRVFRSLNEDQRQIVSEAVVNRLGRARPGQQDVTGEKFSSETFLTNWSRINDEAKAQLFPNHDMRAKLNAIAAVSSGIRDAKVPFANTSGTAQGISAGAVYGSVPLAAGAALTGNAATAGATLAAAGSLVAGANIGARMLTSPKVVNWLAQSAKAKTPEQTTAQMGRLAVIYSQTQDAQLKQELGEYINSIR